MNFDGWFLSSGSTLNANNSALVAEFRMQCLKLERRSEDLVNAPEGRRLSSLFSGS